MQHREILDRANFDILPASTVKTAEFYQLFVIAFSLVKFPVGLFPRQICESS